MAPDEQDEVDRAWLLARSKGEHVEHPDPERAASYVRLEQALAALEPPRPGAGWQGRVLAAITPWGRFKAWARAAWARAWRWALGRRGGSPLGRGAGGRCT